MTTPSTFPSTVGQVLTRRSARPTSARTAPIFEDRSWISAELEDAVRRGAAQVLASGQAPGDRVSAYAKNATPTSRCTSAAPARASSTSQ